MTDEIDSNLIPFKLFRVISRALNFRRRTTFIQERRHHCLANFEIVKDVPVIAQVVQKIIRNLIPIQCQCHFIL